MYEDLLLPDTSTNTSCHDLSYTHSSHYFIHQISVRAVQGARLTMEDEYKVADGGKFAAVFDGHGGGGVSAFLKNHLYRNITQSLQIIHEDETGLHWEPGMTNTVSVPSLATYVSALRQAFRKVEVDVLSDKSLNYQGSTAVAVLVHDNHGHRTVLSANVGDSRAILSRDGKAVDLTRDHKPSDEREKAHILSRGGTVEWDRSSRVHRVRHLSLSRAIGDGYAKPIVGSEVEIKRYPVYEGQDEFMVLASDGLWDVMTSQDVVSFVHQQLATDLAGSDGLSQDELKRSKIISRKNMAKCIAREAIFRGTGDNVCVVMVWL